MMYGAEWWAVKKAQGVESPSWRELGMKDISKKVQESRFEWYGENMWARV